MIKRAPAPTSDYVSSLYRQRLSDGDELGLRNRIVETRALCDMTHQVTIPEQYRVITKEVRTPFTRDTWLRVTAALTQNPPVAHIEPREETAEQRRSANIAERWTQAAVEAMNESLGEDVVYEATKALVRDGESVIKVVHRPDAWAKFPRREKGDTADEYEKRVESFQKGVVLPFAWRVVDRLSMLFGDGEYGDDWALEYGEYPTPYLQHRYEMETDRDGRLRNPAYALGGKPKPEGYLQVGAGRTVKIEYWDQDWWHVTIDGEDAPGFPRPNPYGCLPYFRAKCYEPVLLALRWLVPALDSLITMKMNWAFLGAYPNPTLEPVMKPEDMILGEDAQPASFEWKPGKMVQAPPGYKFGFVSPPPVGEDINQLIIILRGLVDVAGVPSVFRGIGGADQAGYAINQLITAANLTYKVLATIAQRQLQRAAISLWRLVEARIRQTVYVMRMPEMNPETGKPRKDSERQWLGLKPSGPATATVAPVDHLAKLLYSFRPVLPTDAQALAMISMQLTNASRPLWSVRHALEKMQEEDPESIIDEMKVEGYLEEPAIKQTILDEALRKAGMPGGQNPAAALVGPTGQPLIPPGQMAAGLAAVPGLNQPLIPPTPATPAIGMGGRAAGAFPGRPSGPRMGG